MEKEVLFAISSYNEKYYFNPITESLPKDIKLEIKKIGVYFVTKLKGTFSIGFYEDGNVFIECSALENDFDYDDIGAKLEIERIKKEKKELISSLIIWYKIFLEIRKGKQIES
ncbi:MAG: hypothetical protein K2L15_03230 [Eubacteriales bacterium]|nr:hypothetical protein [Eubacteriales bacterium]